MFNIDHYVEQVRNAGSTAGIVARSYGDRVLTRLDAIAEAVQSEEYIEQRRILDTVSDIPLNGSQDIAVVPVGEEWIVEWMSWVPSANATASNIWLSMDGRPIIGTRSTGPGWFGGNGLAVHAGSTLTVAVTTGVAGRFLLQVKTKRKKPAKVSRTAGRYEVGQDGEREAVGEETTGRHTGPPSMIGVSGHTNGGPVIVG